MVAFLCREKYNETLPASLKHGPPFTRLLWPLCWMRLLAFPVSEGSSLCAGRGDWPLDPHEILVHPRDLEKLRVPAFGYVSINRGTGNSASTSSSARSTSTRERSTYSAGREGTQTRTKEERGEAKQEEVVVTFCRAIPHDYLQPGETLAPAWLLRAVGVRPRQHISVFPAVIADPTDQAADKNDLPTYSCLVKVSRVLPEQRSHRSVGEEGGAAAGAVQQSWSHSRRPDKQQQQPQEQRQRPQTIHDRAIVRRLSGCLARTGSLLVAEVLGETVLLQVVSITDGGNDDDRRGHGGGHYVAAPSPDANKAVIRGGGSGNGGGGGAGDDAADNDTSCPPHIITATTKVVVVDSVVVEQFNIASYGSSNSSNSGISSAWRQHDVSQGLLDTVAPTRGRFDAHCGGSEETWTRRAPGLETALGELHALVLLSVGGMECGTDRPRGGHPSAGDDASQKNYGFGPRVRPTPPHSTLPQIGQQTLSPRPPPPPGRHGLAPGKRSGEHVRNLGDGAAVRWSDILPAGTLLCGPSGVGKTLALDVLSQDLSERHGVHVIRLLGPQIIAGVTHAGRNSNSSNDGPQGPLALSLVEARARAPAILVLDELDAIFDAGGGDEGTAPLGEVARASVALLQTLDLASAIEGVAVLGATRRSPGGSGGAGWAGVENGGGGGGGRDGAAVPAAFRKPGRFDRCVAVGPPTQAERERIFATLLSSTREWDLEPLAASLTNDEVATEAPGQNDQRIVESKSKGLTNRLPSPAPPGAGRCTRQGAKIDGVETQSREISDRPEAGARGSVQAGVVGVWAKRLSSVTPGMVGGDLDRLVRTSRARASQRKRNAERHASQPGRQMDAGNVADLSRPPPRLSPQQQQPQPQPPSQQQHHQPQEQSLPSTVLMWRDVMGAVATTVPRSLRGMDVTSSSGAGDGSGSLTWDSVGGFSEAKRRLQRLVQWPWLHPEAFARMGVSAPAGALLYGPSGCGKSLVAQVLATECLANFVWVRSSELLSR